MVVQIQKFVYLNRYDDLTLIQHALKLLIPDTDLSWFEALDVTSIDELYDSVLAYFHTKQPSWLLEQTLCNRQMTNNENLEAYISDIQLLSDRLSKTEKEKMSAFVRGLASNIRTVVVQKDPCSWDETCNCARLAQEALHITHPTERKVSPDIHSILESQSKTINELAKVVMRVQEKSGQSTINICAANASGRDPLMCQYCYRPNHKAKECPRILRQRTNGGSRYGPRLKKCDICKMNGHIARDCWYREKH